MNAFATTDVGIERNVNQDYVYAKLDDIGCLPNLFIVNIQFLDTEYGLTVLQALFLSQNSLHGLPFCWP